MSTRLKNKVFLVYVVGRIVNVLNFYTTSKSKIHTILY